MKIIANKKLMVLEAIASASLLLAGWLYAQDAVLVWVPPLMVGAMAISLIKTYAREPPP